MIPLNTANEIEVRSIAGRFGVPVESSIVTRGGFSGATVYRIHSPSGSVFALRRTPVATAMPPDRYCEWFALLDEISRSGCDVIPVPLPHRQTLLATPLASDVQHSVNADASVTRIRSDQYVWQMEPWMPGAPAEGLPTSHQVESTLETLSVLHQSAARIVQMRSNNQFFVAAKGISPGIVRRLSIVTELHDGLLAQFIKATANEPDREFRDYAHRLCKSLESWLPWLRQELFTAAGSSFPLQPVIRDLWRPHVLFIGDRVTGLIDLNAMATDHIGLDITRLARSWFGADVRRTHETVSQFCRDRLLSKEECRLLRVLDAATVLLSPVTWLRRRFTDSASQPTAPETLQRLAELTNVADCFEPLDLSSLS